MDSAARVDKVLSCFEAHQVQLVEWENHLLRRLGYPAVTSVGISIRLVYVVSDTVDG
jgi:hypothetical protein